MKTSQLAKRVFDSKVGLGIVWGLLELGVWLWFFFQPDLVGYGLPFLVIFTVSFLAGYRLNKPLRHGYGWAGSLLLSQATAFVILALLLLTSFPVLSPPSSYDLYYTTSSLLYTVGAFILSFFLAVFGCLFGALTGEHFFYPPRERRLTTTDYRLVFLGIALLLLLPIILFPAYNYVRVVSDKLNLRDYATIVNNRKVSWNAGTQNVSISFGPLGENSGYLSIGWYSTSPLTLVVQGDRTFTRTGSSSNGLFNIPFAGSKTVFPAWFEIDNCPSSGCASGFVTYTITLWY